MTNFSTCKGCGNKFTNKEGDYCNSCTPSVEDESFKVIRSFLEKNPQSSVMDVVSGTGIPSNLVIKFINEGRVSIDDSKANNKNSKSGVYIGKEKPSFGFRSVDDRGLRKRRHRG